MVTKLDKFPSLGELRTKVRNNFCSRLQEKYEHPYKQASQTGSETTSAESRYMSSSKQPTGVLASMKEMYEKTTMGQFEVVTQEVPTIDGIPSLKKSASVSTGISKQGILSRLP